MPNSPVNIDSKIMNNRGKRSGELEQIGKGTGLLGKPIVSLTTLGGRRRKKCMNIWIDKVISSQSDKKNRGIRGVQQLRHFGGLSARVPFS